MSTTNGRSGRSGSVSEVKLNQSAFDNSRLNQEDKTFKIIEERIGLTTGTQFFYQYDQLLFKGDAPAELLNRANPSAMSWSSQLFLEPGMGASVQGSKKYVSKLFLNCGRVGVKSAKVLLVKFTFFLLCHNLRFDTHHILMCH